MYLDSGTFSEVAYAVGTCCCSWLNSFLGEYGSLQRIEVGMQTFRTAVLVSLPRQTRCALFKALNFCYSNDALINENNWVKTEHKENLPFIQRAIKGQNVLL